MPKFVYKAQLIATGVELEGTEEAENKLDLARRLKDEGKMLLTATEITSSTLNIDRINAFLSRVDLKEKIQFARNLATMLAAGLPLARAMSIFIRQTKNPKLKQVLVSISDDINKGMPLSDAMAKFPKIFPSIFIAMVRAGEESGGLVEALNVVGGQMEKTYMLKKKVKGAMIYPAVVLCVMIAVGVLMMIYIVPGLAGSFKEMNVELPMMTKIVIGVSDFLQNEWYFAILLVVFSAGALWSFQRTQIGKHVIHWAVLRLPIFGNLAQEFNSALATRTLSSLISAGVDIVRALEITKEVVTNVHYKATLEQARANVQKGVPLSQTFTRHTDIYPVMVGDMAEVGEETGKLSDMLLKIAVFYEGEVDAATNDMSKLIEPILMIVIATFVGIFAYSMITPMYSLMNNI
jgi:type IV pilus assembly protein PilC